MRSTFLPFIAVLLSVIFAASYRTPGNAVSQNAALTGTKPAIDASRFASLQAALDALPKQGGIVKLPPGTFEITEPLVLSTENVLLEGSGMATHIVNKLDPPHVLIDWIERFQATLKGSPACSQ